MAVSFVAASEDDRGTTNTVVPTPPSGYQSGDLLLAIHASDKRGTLASMTAPSGWTEISNASRSDVGFIKVWKKTATSSEPATYSFPDSTSAHCDIVIVAVRGFDPSQPLLVTPTWSNGASSTTHPAPSVTGASGGLLVTAHMAGTSGTTRSYTSGPSGMTIAQDSTLSSGAYILEAVYYQALSSSAATGSKIATCSASTPYITMSLVVQQPSALAVSPIGISTAEMFGVPTVSVGSAAQTINAIGIPSTEAFGTPAVARSDVIVFAGNYAPEASGTSVSFDKPTGTDTNDIVLVFLYKEDPGVVTPPAGWTEIGHQSTTGAQDHDTHVFWHRAGAVEGSAYTFSWTANVWRTGFAVTLRGCVTGVSPVDVYNGNTSGSTAVATSPSVSVTTTNADRFLVWFGGTWNYTTWPPPPGFTAIVPPSAPNPNLLAAAYAVQPLAGSSGAVQTTTPESYAKTAHLVALIQEGQVYPDFVLFPGTDIFPGDASAAAPDQTLLPAAIGSAEAFGSPVVSAANGPLTVLPVGIDSAETFPIPLVTVDPLPPQTVQTVGITTAEAFGRPTLTLAIPIPPPGSVSYFVDGVDLQNYAARIEVAEGLQDTPGVVGDNVELPGRDGELQVFGGLGQPRRPDASGRITFNLWLKGVDRSTGLIPGGSSTAEQWYARWDELVRLFHRRIVAIDHPRPDGTIRRAFGHLLPDESIAPTRERSSPWFGRFKATFTIPGGHWTDLTPVTTGQLSLTTNGYVDLSVFSAATAACTELQITFGPGNNPRLSTSSGHIGWNGVIAAGRQLGIDTATGYTHQASGASWIPGFEGLTYSPGPRLFEIDPSEPLQGVFTHTTGAGQTMTVEVAGKRRYRTS